MDSNSRVEQFPAQAAFKAECEFRLHGGAGVAKTRQADERGFDSAVKIAAADVKYAHEIDQ